MYNGISCAAGYGDLIIGIACGDLINGAVFDISHKIFVVVIIIITSSIRFVRIIRYWVVQCYLTCCSKATGCPIR